MCKKGKQLSAALQLVARSESGPITGVVRVLSRNSRRGSACFFHGRISLCCPKLSANLRELAVGQRLGEDAAVDESESVPFGGTFGLEVPEDPKNQCQQYIQSPTPSLSSKKTHHPLVLRSKVSSWASMKPRMSSLKVCVQVSMKLMLSQLPW